MDSITKARPNHYEALGLTPSASEAEVSRAFALAMSPLRPRALSDIAAASVAYEALRDPLRRRAYDVSIGLRPEKDPVPKTPQGWQRIGAVHAGPVAAVPVRAVVPMPEPEARQAPEPEAPLRPEPETRQRPEPETYVRRQPLPAIEDRPVQWRRPAAVIGGLFAGVAAIGAAAGLWAARDVEPQKAEAAVAPSVRHVEAGSAALPDVAPPAPALADVQPESRPPARRPAPAKPKAPPAKPSPSLVAVEEAALSDQAEALRADEAPEISTEQVAAQASEATARMPLSNAAIERTLGKIGYACGSVASTEAVGGAFKVTCTSGDSYRAAPVRGRYHFKRWSGR